MNVPEPLPELVYKIATTASFELAQQSRVFAGMPIDAQDGFIHLSTAAQLAETLRRHFKGQADLLLVAVRTADVADALRWEPSRGGDLFPHLYAPMELSAVAWTAPISVDADGRCDLPEPVR
jgi:uncharacterized protein (DUF952 family)